MAESRHLELEGRDYTWSGAEWYETETYLAPPETVVRLLNARLSKDLGQEDLAIADIDTLLETAKTARDVLHYERAERLARRVLGLAPGNLGALAIGGKVVANLLALGGPVTGQIPGLPTFFVRVRTDGREESNQRSALKLGRIWSG
jgi:hypothetical protein